MLKAGLEKMGANVPEDELAAIYTEFDGDGDGMKWAAAGVSFLQLPLLVPRAPRRKPEPCRVSAGV